MFKGSSVWSSNIQMFKCSSVLMFKHSNVQNVHMHRDSTGRGVRSNWWFWIGVCAALLVSAAATDQGTPLLGRILLLMRAIVTSYFRKGVYTFPYFTGLFFVYLILYSIGVCGALLVSAATDQGTPLLRGRISSWAEIYLILIHRSMVLIWSEGGAATN